MKKLIIIAALLISGLAISRTVEVAVHGMTCAFCIDSLNSQLNKFDSIYKVEVSLKNNKIKLVTDATEPSIESIKQAVLNAGFTPVSVKVTE
ncbi:MAG: heavy-metal-associated domain-containing protein [Proteobacteria bacterium]|nr:heavy-metal-associated domain-containing protein [Pseudomonadota bacterium]